MNEGMQTGTEPVWRRILVIDGAGGDFGCQKKLRLTRHPGSCGRQYMFLSQRIVQSELSYRKISLATSAEKMKRHQRIAIKQEVEKALNLQERQHLCELLDGRGCQRTRRCVSELCQLLSI